MALKGTPSSQDPAARLARALGEALKFGGELLKAAGADAGEFKRQDWHTFDPSDDWHIGFAKAIASSAGKVSVRAGRLVEAWCKWYSARNLYDLRPSRFKSIEEWRNGIKRTVGSWIDLHSATGIRMDRQKSPKEWQTSEYWVEQAKRRASRLAGNNALKRVKEDSAWNRMLETPEIDEMWRLRKPSGSSIQLRWDAVTTQVALACRDVLNDLLVPEKHRGIPKQLADAVREQRKGTRKWPEGLRLHFYRAAGCEVVTLLTDVISKGSPELREAAFEFYAEQFEGGDVVGAADTVASLIGPGVLVGIAAEFAGKKKYELVKRLLEHQNGLPNGDNVGCFVLYAEALIKCKEKRRAKFYVAELLASQDAVTRTGLIREAEKMGLVDVIELLCCEADDRRADDDGSGGGDKVKGVTLFRAAMMLNDDDEEAAHLVKKRWRNKKAPKLPSPIGKNLQDKQEDIFKPSALCDFLEESGDLTPEERPKFFRDLLNRQVPGTPL